MMIKKPKFSWVKLEVSIRRVKNDLVLVYCKTDDNILVQASVSTLKHSGEYAKFPAKERRAILVLADIAQHIEAQGVAIDPQLLTKITRLAKKFNKI